MYITALTTHRAIMCIYWKKLHTCGHTSDRPYIEMCRPGCLSNTVCSDIGQDDKPRKSHFPCYPCIKVEARAEAEALARAERDAVIKAHQARNVAIREKLAAEQRAKEERIRREARETADKEREEEARLKTIKEKEEELAKKQGGAWIETSGGKKQKGRKGTALGAPTISLSTPPVLKTLLTKDKKENDHEAKLSPKKDAKGTDTGGRAGIWGPKKILSRKENAAVKK
jgi:hypothetical protein